MKFFSATLYRAFLLLVVFTVICGLCYNFAITVAAQFLFPYQAGGSIIEVNGKRYGSELVGQQFSDMNHMWGRIMTIDTTTFTDPDGNALLYGVPSHISPASEEYSALVAQRVENIRAAHPDKGELAIPVDLVTGSGSGLDPQISVAAAQYQIGRIAKNTGRSEAEIIKIVDSCTTQPFLGIFGEATVNVLKVNLTLDGILK